MSNKPNSNRFNSNRDRSFYSISNTEGNITKDTFLKNGSNIIMKDYSNFTVPNRDRDSSLMGGKENEAFNPYVMDSKIKDLESKLETLEQANKILIERINNNEKNFSLQIKQMEVNNAEERENRYKAEKALNIISEQNNANSNDLNMKINLLEERMVKGDENKTQQRQFDLESQKYLIGKLTEKITKTVKSEVDARFKADMDGKIFAQKLNNKFESSLDILKKEIEEIANQTKVEMQNISRECSERTHNVSKYIDQQIQEAVFGKGSSNDELKNFVRKLTEQVKSSLISISKKHEIIEERLNNIENKDDKKKTDYHTYMTLVEQRLMKKINDVKLFTEINMTRHDQYLEQYMKEITLKIEKNIQFIAGQLIDTRNKVNERFEKIFEEHHDQYKKICEDMEEICNRVYKYENLIKEYENKYNNIIENVNKSIANIYVREDIQIVQERIIKTIECNFLQEQINDIHNALQTYNVQFNENMTELNKGSLNSFQFLENQLKEQKNEMIKMGDKNIMMFEEFQKNSDNIEVKQIVNEMVTKVDNLLVMESIQNSKNAEFNIMKTIEEHKNNIMDSINEINNNKEDISQLKDKVNTIQSSLDKSGLNMSGMADQMKKMREEAHEIEMKESVNKIMDLMITNVENTLTKERMDKIGQFDLSKMRETIIDLEDKYNSLSNTNTEIETIKENINQLTAEQEILKNKPKGGDDIKLATIQMINNVEFENIYSILNSGKIGSSKEEISLKDYNEMVDNKISNAMEKIKNDNENMWIKCVQMKDKVTDPEEIKRILTDLRPAILSTQDSYKEILEVNSNDEQYYSIPKLNINLNSNSNYDYGNNYNNQQDPGPEINSKKSSKKSSKKNKNINNDNNNNNNDNNLINNQEVNKNLKEEKKSQNSKGSKNAQQPNEEIKSKGTNKSKNAQPINEEKKSKTSNKSKNAQPINEENKSKASNKSKNAQPINEENKSKGSNKSKNKNIEQPVNNEKKSNNNNEKESSKNKKINPQPEDNKENNQNPEEELKDDNKNNENPGEEEENEENEEEEDDEMGENEDFGGELKSDNRVSGKTKPNIKK